MWIGGNVIPATAYRESPVWIPASGPPPPFSPTDIAGCQQWLAGKNITGLADGDPLLTWSDASGNGRDVTTFIVGTIYKTGAYNGLPVARFANSALIGGISSVVPSAFTFFVVTQNRSGGTIYEIRKFGNGTPIKAYADTSGTIFYRDNAGSLTSLSGLGNLLAITWDGTTMEAFVNGSSVGTTSAPAPSTTDLIVVGADVGGGTPLTADIAEIILYDSKLGTTDLATVTTYLQTQYAI